MNEATDVPPPAKDSSDDTVTHVGPLRVMRSGGSKFRWKVVTPRGSCLYLRRTYAEAMGAAQLANIAPHWTKR